MDVVEVWGHKSQRVRTLPGWSDMGVLPWRCRSASGNELAVVSHGTTTAEKPPKSRATTCAPEAEGKAESKRFSAAARRRVTPQKAVRNGERRYGTKKCERTAPRRVTK